jgi:plasmid stability protein
LALGETSVAKKKATLPKSATDVAPRIKKTTGTGRTSDRIQLRLPEGMRDKLVEAAMANGRSISDEIIDRLTQSLERDEMQRLSDRLKAQSDRLATFEGEIASMVEQLRLRDD